MPCLLQGSHLLKQCCLTCAVLSHFFHPYQEKTALPLTSASLRFQKQSDVTDAALCYLILHAPPKCEIVFNSALVLQSKSVICLRKPVKIIPDLFHSSYGEKKEFIAVVKLENKMCISKSWTSKFKCVSTKALFSLNLHLSHRHLLLLCTF